MNQLKLVYPYINAPVFECLVPEKMKSLGIGNVVVAKKGGAGKIGMAGFLVDIYCLGVKDAFSYVGPEAEYRYKIAHISSTEKLNPVEPAYAKKLIEGAVAYAQSFGISPYPDYKYAQKVLFSIDAGQCPAQFEYGKEGKPFFVAGPNDGPGRCRQIENLLEKKCGRGGYHFIMPSGLD